MLAPIIVNSSRDDGDGSKTTLREAIEAANFNPDPDTIKFDETEFAGGGTILLDRSLGEFWITESVTIDGTDTSGVPLGVTIDAGKGADGQFGTGDGFRIFNITGGSSKLVTLKGLTLTGGDAPYFGGAVCASAQMVGDAHPTALGDNPLALAA